MFGANYFGQPYFAQGYGGGGVGDSIAAGYPRPASFLDIPRSINSHTDKGTGLPREIKSLGSIETGKPFGLESEIKPYGFIENQLANSLFTRTLIEGDIHVVKPSGLISEKEPVGTMETKVSSPAVRELDKPTAV